MSCDNIVQGGGWLAPPVPSGVFYHGRQRCLKPVGQRSLGARPAVRALPYTMEDFRRDFVKDHLKDLPPDLRREDLSPEQVLRILVAQDFLRSLPPEEILKLLPPEEIRKVLPREAIEDFVKRLQNGPSPPPHRGDHPG